MSVELVGPKGILRLEHDGPSTITRDDEPILALRRAFIQVFGTTLPVLALAEARVDNGTLQATFDTSRKDLTIALPARATPDGFQMAWSTPPPTPSISPTPGMRGALSSSMSGWGPSPTTPPGMSFKAASWGGWRPTPASLLSTS
jgi:hypothetical protein